MTQNELKEKITHYIKIKYYFYHCAGYENQLIECVAKTFWYNIV